jgi:hypothetical protein
MTQEAATPPGFWERVEQIAERAVQRFARSGFLRNASITGGGLTLRGGFFRMRNAAGTSNAFYVGPVTPAQPDGTKQPGWLVYRADGTLVLAMFDAFPEDGPEGVNQALNWYDRSGGIVLADDTDSGQGLARPYVPIPLTRARYTDMVAVTDGAFVDVFDSGYFYKVNARARVDVRCTTDASDTTGELRVLVDGVQVGTTQTVDFLVTMKNIGPFVIPGDAYSQHVVKVQARRTTGTGAVRLAAAAWGMQT